MRFVERSDLLWDNPENALDNQGARKHGSFLFLDFQAAYAS